MTWDLFCPIYGEMSEDRVPYKRIVKIENPSDMDQVKRALEVYKTWIWRDGTEIAALRTRMKNLEQDQKDLRAFINRILTQSDN